MTPFRIQPGAEHRLEQIYAYTFATWGETQADRYLLGLFDHFQTIADRRVLWRPVPAEFGAEGYVCRYEKHFIYWRELDGGDVGIVTVLHERMHQMRRFREDFPS